MPTERFLRLSEKKKQAIREAAKKEFSRVPYEKVSINQIIQNADISRGSFYTYFKDKEDVVRWLFEDSCKEVEEFCRGCLEESHGDVFAMLEKLFEYFVSAIQKTDEMLEMTRNILSNQENLKIFGLEGMPDPNTIGVEGTPGRWIYDKIDKNLLYKEGIEAFLPVLTMGASVLLLQVKQYYEYPQCRDAIRSRFYIGIELLRRGAYKHHTSEEDAGI